MASTGLVVTSIVLSLGLAEGLLRLFPALLPGQLRELVHGGTKNQGVNHPYIGHLHTPNGAFTLTGTDFKAVHHVDGYGFRNTEPWPDRAEILVFGDSVVFGHGVEDDQAWPAILAASMPQVRVINLGLEGAGPQQYLRIYETFGTTLRPKVVLVGFFARNDFWDAELFDRWLKSGSGDNYMVWRDFGKPEIVALSLRHPIVSMESILKGRIYPLARQTYLFNVLNEFRNAVKARLRSEPKTVHFADGTRLQLLPSDLTSKTVEAQPGRREFQLVVDALQRIHSLAAQNGTRTLIVFQPSKEEVYLPLLGEPAPDPSRPLRRVLDDIGIAYLDLLPAFRERAKAGERLFFEWDGHPNAAGYALIAERVASYIKENHRNYGLVE